MSSQSYFRRIRVKIRVKHVGVAQCAKMIAGIYFVISLPIVACILLLAMAAGKASIGVGSLILLPFGYALWQLPWRTPDGMAL